MFAMPEDALEMSRLININQSLINDDMFFRTQLEERLQRLNERIRTIAKGEFEAGGFRTLNQEFWARRTGGNEPIYNARGICQQ